MKELILSSMKGINSTIFAYGQTSSGKTYTMIGEKTNPGVTPLALDEIFQNLNNEKNNCLLNINSTGKQRHMKQVFSTNL